MSPESKIKVIYLTRWYPNRYDPMPGLFIQRHAEAANKCCRVGVVYTHVVENEKVGGFETELSNVNGVFTAKVYYQNPSVNIPLLTPLIKAFRFFKANAIGIRKIRRELEGFDMLHVHILTRLGLIALFYKWFRKKPYAISEHWSRYLPLTGSFNGFLRKRVTRLVVRHAALVTTVTENLAKAMQDHGLKNNNYKVLANVVSDDFFINHRPPNKRDKRTTIVHVSCFEDKSKNISGLVRVIKSLSLVRNDFRFKLIGDGMDFKEIKAYAVKLGLRKEQLLFSGMLEGKDLVKEMSDAKLMVLFSNYENFPVVINESFVMGIPVIATSVGGIPEFVNNRNGRLVEARDEAALEKAIIDFLDGKTKFSGKSIRSESMQTFSPDTIGKELCSMYRQIVS